MSPSLVFDTTVLSHFARADRFEDLAGIVSDRACVTPTQVMEELNAGLADHPDLEAAISAEWISTVEVISAEEMVAFARYKDELGGGATANVGEAVVLAWVVVNGGMAIIDERPATRLARRDGLAVHGSLFLIVHGIRAGRLSPSEAEALVDELRATGMRLPIDGRRLFAWAYDEGLMAGPWPLDG